MLQRFRQIRPTSRVAGVLACAALMSSACGSRPAADLATGSAGEQAWMVPSQPAGTDGTSGDPVVEDFAPTAAAIETRPATSAARESRDPLHAQGGAHVAADAEDFSLPSRVSLIRHDVSVSLPDADDFGLLAATAAADLRATTVTAPFTVALTTADDPAALTILGVDPTGFRPFAPELSAQEPAVWESLRRGDLVVRHDIAVKHQLELGEWYEITTPAGTTSVRIGAYASNGAPPLADALSSRDLQRELAPFAVLQLMSSVREPDTRDAVAKSLRAALPTADITVHEPPKPTVLRQSVASGVEPFRYVDYGDGMIEIDRAWVRQYIVGVDLPRVGKAYVHRAMADPLVSAMNTIVAEGLIDHFDPNQFAGGWVPRHQDWDPRYPLSMHAWGLAIDFNSHDNCLGCEPTMDRRIVDVFKAHGFRWGGDWARPDGMHFEFTR